MTNTPITEHSEPSRSTGEFRVKRAALQTPQNNRSVRGPFFTNFNSPVRGGDKLSDSNPLLSYPEYPGLNYEYQSNQMNLHY